MQLEVIQQTVFSIQVCVPATATDEEVLLAAEVAVPCGTRAGWSIRRATEDDADYQERVPCAEHEDRCHLVLEA